MWGGNSQLHSHLTATTPALSSQCPEPDTPASVDLVALAELEGLRAVVELLGLDDALVREQPLEGREPALVVAGRLGLVPGPGDLVDEGPRVLPPPATPPVLGGP